MSDTCEWRTIYGRPTMFIGGQGVGDCYPSKGAEGDVWRVRLWNENRLQGGREKYILASAGEETARQVLEGMYERAKREGAE